MNEPLDLSNIQNEGKDRPQKEAEAPASRIERLQEKLYSPNTQFQIRKRKNLHQKESQFHEDWDKDKSENFSETIKKVPKFSVFAIVAIVAFIFFAGSVGYAFFTFYGGQQTISGNDVEITIVGPVSIGGGEELTLDIIVENRNQVPIQTVDLVIEYPDGTKSSSDLKTALPRIRDGLGDIAPNSVVKENYQSALFGEEGDQKSIKVSIEYRIPGSTAIFEREKTFEIALQSSPIRLAINTVKEITSNQEISFDLIISSNSNKTLENVLLTAKYPFGFTFSSSDIKPSSGNNIWFFDELKPQEEKKFQVRGVLEGQNTEERIFKWMAGIADDLQPDKLGVMFTSVPKAVTIIEPFLALDIDIDGALENDLIIDGATAVEGHLTFTNNTGASIRDTEIKLKLDGEVLQDSKVEVSKGFFNSTDNTITWNKTTDPLFEEIAIGGTDVLIFRFQTKPLATRSAVYKNPEIKIDAKVTGRRLSESGVPENVESVAVKRIKVASDVSLSAISSYFGEPFVNTGPIPPKVETETTYTVTLSVTNSSNAIENGLVTAVLPEYMKWNNRVSPSNEKVFFDPVTRKIEWDLGDVREHAGFIDPARVVSFQVTLTPSASQIGNIPSLIFKPTFIGLDTFTNSNIASVSEEPNTDFGQRSETLEEGKVTP